MTTNAVFSGLIKIVSMRSKHDAWCVLLLTLLTVLLVLHDIDPMTATALVAPVVAHIFADHKENLSAIAKVDSLTKAA